MPKKKIIGQMYNDSNIIFFAELFCCILNYNVHQLYLY
jgi:hypothetical protein